MGYYAVASGDPAVAAATKLPSLPNRTIRHLVFLTESHWKTVEDKKLAASRAAQDETLSAARELDENDQRALEGHRQAALKREADHQANTARIGVVTILPAVVRQAADQEAAARRQLLLPDIHRLNFILKREDARDWPEIFRIVEILRISNDVYDLGPEGDPLLDCARALRFFHRPLGPMLLKASVAWTAQFTKLAQDPHSDPRALRKASDEVMAILIATHETAAQRILNKSMRRIETERRVDALQNKIQSLRDTAAPAVSPATNGSANKSITVARARVVVMAVEPYSVLTPEPVPTSSHASANGTHANGVAPVLSAANGAPPAVPNINANPPRTPGHFVPSKPPYQQASLWDAFRKLTPMEYLPSGFAAGGLMMVILLFIHRLSTDINQRYSDIAPRYIVTFGVLISGALLGILFGMAVARREYEEEDATPGGRRIFIVVGSVVGLVMGLVASAGPAVIVEWVLRYVYTSNLKVPSLWPHAPEGFFAALVFATNTHHRELPRAA